MTTSNYGYTEHDHNWWAVRYRQGSAMLVIGWILIGFAAMGGIYFFSSVAVGSSLLLWCTGALGAVGLAMVMIGSGMRKRPQTEFVEAEHREDKIA